MAADSASDVAIPMPGGPDDVPIMRATMESMVDSITTLQNQMAVLFEEPDLFFTRSPDASTGERDFAVRELAYAHDLQSGHMEMHDLEAIAKNNSRMGDLVSTVAFYSSELTTGRDKIDTMYEALIGLRNDLGSSRSIVTGERRDRQIVTAIRGLDKLKIYKGTSTEWEEWRFKLTSWLGQSSRSYETDYGQARLRRDRTRRARRRPDLNGWSVRTHHG